MKKAILLLKDIRLRPSQIHKFRGFIGNLFRDYDLIHNHDVTTGKPKYRYPLIQFKLINDTPAVVAVTDRAVDIFSEIFLKMDKIIIDGITIPVFEKDLQIEEVEFTYSSETFMYEFLTPWIGLNQKNYQKYINAKTNAEKNEILERTLIGNILSMSKYLDYWLGQNQKLHANLQVRKKTVNLKAKPMIGFIGIFKTNFIIPDYLGVGKSVSRGFGTVRRILM
ncbi:MAG: CRISPR-associated endonuclease Cas6 [Thermodesulfobacteriota bacterium]|nr:CRISPR-associated endonuclease Cas6 [Thermodesulfobacteriota bacterium]